MRPSFGCGQAFATDVAREDVIWPIGMRQNIHKSQGPPALVATCFFEMERVNFFHVTVANNPPSSLWLAFPLVEFSFHRHIPNVGFY